MEKRVEILCFYQLNPPTDAMRKEGWGNCSECKPDEENTNCPGYLRVVIYRVGKGGGDSDDVEDGQSEMYAV